MVTHNRDLTSRMNWFDRQFLRAQDFADEQDYAVDRRRRHNRLLHTAGVAEGLAVTGEPQSATVTVGPGMAIDTAGRELVLLDSVSQPLPGEWGAAKKAEVYVVYEEQQVAPSTDPGVTDQATRLREAVRLAFRRTDPDAEPVPTSQTPAVGAGAPVPGVLVATLDLTGGKLASAPSTAGRRNAGALLDQAAVPELQLKVAQKAQGDWPRLLGEATKTVGVDGHVHVQPGYDLVVGGTPSTGARLHYDEQSKLITLTAANGVTVSSSAGDALAVTGNARLGANPVKVSGGWSGFPDAAPNQAEIANDTGSYKTLMIVGNKSGGGNVRRVGIWDQLDVNGTMNVTGALTPSVGNDAQHGIQFPANPGGGAGDEAYIRYYARAGESTALVLGVRNDADDRISFVQSEKERLALVGGMLHMGSLDGSNVAPNTVLGSVGFWGPSQQHGQLSFRAKRGFEMVDRSADGPSLDYAPDSKPYADLWAGNAHATGVTLPGGGIVTATGRMHVAGDETLYLLNKTGVVVSKAWQGNGNLTVEGATAVGGRVQAQFFGTGDKPGDSGYPTGWGGGVHTWDVYAEGTIGTGTGGTLVAGIDSGGRVFGKTKPFVIDHPLDPERKSLVHAAVEGPEHGVYYRGEATLVDGRAEVHLPEYFEALTRVEGRTVHLTPVLPDDDGEVHALAASRVRDGRFTVRTVDGRPASHGFYWEVRAVRADVETLVTEIIKADATRPHDRRAVDGSAALAGTP